MKYYTWKLDWSSGEGIDPTASVNNDEVRIEPQFATGNLDNADTVIYATLSKGTIDVSKLAKWSVEETTLEAMTQAALEIDAEASIIDGRIVWPITEMEIV